MRENNQNIIEDVHPLIKKFISKNTDFKSFNHLTISTSNIINFSSFKFENKTSILNLKKSNTFRYTNKFFEAINYSIDNGVKYIGCVETIELRKIRLRKKYSYFFWRIYSFFDFIFTRIFPKLYFFKKIYFFVTKGESKVLSKAETLGRLVSCGFKIIDFKIINLEYPLMFFVVEKIGVPTLNVKSSYGPFFKMNRIGKNQKILGVYKLRTMHPFSEYLQDYVLEKNGNSANGKILNDFRLTYWSKFIRKYWLDEAPQIINVIKGEMNLFGPRPVSETRFKQFPADFQALRSKYKPGCIPAYLAFNYSSDAEALIKAEFKYLKMLEKYGVFVNLLLIVAAIYNIIFKFRRSA